VGAPTIERAEEPLALVGGDPSAPGQRAIPFMPGLEGLRGVALVAVLFFHGGFSWAKGGFLGVSTFFTLSGFLITLLLIWEFSTHGRISLRQFWGRRYRRLMPASLLCLAGVVLFGWLVATPGQVANLRGDVLASLLYVANWRFIVTQQSYAQIFSAPSPVLHFWSLAIEEQFYLVFPLVVAGVLGVARGSRRALGAVLVVAAAGSLGLMWLLYTPGQDPSRVYYGTGTRAFELLLGALLAIVLSHPAGLVMRVPRWAWAAAGIIGAAVTLFLWSTASQTDSWLYRGGLAGYALMSCLVIVAAIRKGPIHSVLSVRPLRWLGAISYGAYLFHWPIFLWLTPSRTHLAIWPLFVLRVSLTLAVAVVSAWLVENPIRLRVRPKRLRPSVVSALAASLIVIGLVAVTPHRSADDTIDFGPVASPALPGPGGSADVATTVSIAPGATIGDSPNLPPKTPLAVGEKPRVLILGDSAAYTLGGGLEKWGRTTGLEQVWDAGKLGCSVGRGGMIRYLGEARAVHDYCDWTSDFPQQLAPVKPHVIMVMFGTWDVVDRQIPGDDQWRHIGDPVYDNFLRSEISSAIDTMTSTGATVVWFTHPYIEAGVREGLAENAPENDSARMDMLNDMVREVIAVKSRAVLVDLQAHMRSTPEGEMNLTERPDGIHWTPNSSFRLAPWVGKTLEAIARGTTPPPVTGG